MEQQRVAVYLNKQVFDDWCSLKLKNDFVDDSDIAHILLNRYNFLGLLKTDVNFQFLSLSLSAFPF